MTIADAIRKARVERGWTKWRLAKSIGVDWQTVHLWEKGDRIPNSQNIIKLLRLFPELTEFLNGGEGNGKKGTRR